MIRVALTQGGADAEAALPSQEVGAVHIEVLIEVCIFSRPGNRKDFAVYPGALVALLGAFGWSTFAAAIVPTVAIGFN